MIEIEKPNIVSEDLSEDDQRFFYISMLAHILELHREQKGKEVN